MLGLAPCAIIAIAVYALSTFKNVANIFICFFFRQNVSIVEIVSLELLCLLIKNMTASFCYSLEVMCDFGRKR